MPAWSQFADWMEFLRLDDGDGITGAFTIAYKITDDGSELWTHRFNRFKNKDKEALAGAVYTFARAVPPLVKKLGIDPVSTLFIPALSSGETSASEKGFIPILTKITADQAGAKYDVSVLKKNAHAPIHNFYSAASRSQELEKANYSATTLVGIETAMVFDDLITRGGTLSRIAKAILAKNAQVKIYGVALGKTERRAYWGELTNQHVSAEWDAHWQTGETRYRQRHAGATK